jgi:hypothetical protein
MLNRTMTLFLNTGKQIKISFGEQVEEFRVAWFMEQALRQGQLVVQLEDRTLVVPYSSIEHIEISPAATQAPAFSVLDARLTAIRAEVEARA